MNAALSYTFFHPYVTCMSFFFFFSQVHSNGERRNDVTDALLYVVTSHAHMWLDLRIDEKNRLSHKCQPTATRHDTVRRWRLNHPTRNCDAPISTNCTVPYAVQTVQCGRPLVRTLRSAYGPVTRWQ